VVRERKGGEGEGGRDGRKTGAASQLILVGINPICLHPFAPPLPPSIPPSLLSPPPSGVLNRTILYPKIRAKTLEILKGYIVHPLLTPALIDQYITPSEWGDNAGIVGALTLAKVALDDKGKNSVLGKAQAYVCKHGAAVFLGVVLGAAATAVGVFGKRK